MNTYVINHLEAIDSTNDEARRRVEWATAPHEFENHIIVAQTQLKGKGRLGRHWYSPPGNLYMTIIKRPQIPLTELSKISLVVGVALHRVLKDYLSQKAHKDLSEIYLALKWPNDILIDKMKVGGILVETEQYAANGAQSVEVQGEQNTLCFIGVGLNLVSSPDLTAYPACALLDFVTELPLLDDLIQRICKELDALLVQWREEGFGPIREEWLWSAYGLGKPICARVENGFQVYGRFTTLNEEGAIILTDDTGNDHVLLSSEISYLT
jgi:BirA family biotin operon repressor/biotin-[acetyl-CoA-carboxylase] ligase